jgi:hypothetical protein
MIVVMVVFLQVIGFVVVQMRMGMVMTRGVLVWMRGIVI